MAACYRSRIEQSRYYRTFRDAFAVYAASYSHPQSAHYQSPDLLRRMEAIVSRLLEVQHPDGTMDAGGNRQSPPDTAFFLKEGTATYTAGGDTITFGPGAYAHDSVRGIDGEVYSTHFGTIAAMGYMCISRGGRRSDM